MVTIPCDYCTCYITCIRVRYTVLQHDLLACLYIMVKE